ncbi:MAG: hypothetical protein DWI28_05250 [Planctomycetota bacterium]|nr:MAG: hypothetical protein DWI28_05250 [Planctomycetota bacterium]
MNSRLTATESKPPKLLDRVRAKLRLLHSSIRTEEAYVEWLERYIQTPARDGCARDRGVPERPRRQPVGLGQYAETSLPPCAKG